MCLSSVLFGTTPIQVPIVADADALGLSEIATTVKDLATRVRTPALGDGGSAHFLHLELRRPFSYLSALTAQLLCNLHQVQLLHVCKGRAVQLLAVAIACNCGSALGTQHRAMLSNSA